MDTMSLLQRVRSYFGMSATEMRKEYPALTTEDKQDFCDEFNKMGLPTELKKA